MGEGNVVGGSKYPGCAAGTDSSSYPGALGSFNSPSSDTEGGTTAVAEVGGKGATTPRSPARSASGASSIVTGFGAWAGLANV